MKKILTIAAIIFTIYLTLSIAASLLVAFGSADLAREVVNNRYGLLVIEYCAEFDTVTILSPFNNECDVFLLVIDWTDDLRIASDGFYMAGSW